MHNADALDYKQIFSLSFSLYLIYHTSVHFKWKFCYVYYLLNKWENQKLMELEQGIDHSHHYEEAHDGESILNLCSYSTAYVLQWVAVLKFPPLTNYCIVELY